MPSLQTALPPELANNVIRLYRECLRRAKYVGSRYSLLHGVEAAGFNRGLKAAFNSILFNFIPYFIDEINLILSGHESKDQMYSGQKKDGKFRQHNTELVVDMVRQQFRKHMHETDPDKIQKLKDDAARGLKSHSI